MPHSNEVYRDGGAYETDWRKVEDEFGGMVAAAHCAGFVDVLPAMLEGEKTGAALYYLKDGHCTPRGYAVVASAIGKYLVAHSLVD